jgi:hypothetical protein
MEYLPPFEFFKTTQALQLHFKNPSFDWFKTPAIKCHAKTFDARKDAQLFAYASSKIKTKDIVQFFIANILAGNKNCVYNVSGEAKDHYQSYVKRISSLSNSFKEELNKVSDVLEKMNASSEKMFSVEYQQHPLILKLFLGDKISLETMVLINKYCRSFIEEYDEKLQNDVIWKKISQRMKKYSPFMDGKDWIAFDASRIKITWFDFVQDSELNLL